MELLKKINEPMISFVFGSMKAIIFDKEQPNGIYAFSVLVFVFLHTVGLTPNNRLKRRVK